MKTLIFTMLFLGGAFAQAETVLVDSLNPLIVVCTLSDDEIEVYDGHSVQLEEGLPGLIERVGEDGTVSATNLEGSCTVGANMIVGPHPSMGISN